VEGADLSIRCSVIKNSGLDGVYLTDGRLFLGDDASNKIENNDVGIHLSDAHEFRLNYGSNRFSNNSSYHIYAELSDYAPGVYATQNGLGLSGNENEFTYVGYGSTQQLPVHIELTTSGAAVDLTGNFGPQIIGCANSIPQGPYQEIYNELSLLAGSQDINTINIDSEDLPELVCGSIIMIESQDSAQIIQAIDRLYEASVYPLSNPNLSDIMAREYAYKLIIEAYGMAIRNGFLPGGGGLSNSTYDTYFQELDSLVQTEISTIDAQDPNYFERKSELMLDIGQILRLGEYYGEAELYFQDSLNWSSAKVLQRAAYWECVCGAENDLIQGLLEADSFEVVMNECNALLPYQRRSRPVPNNYQGKDGKESALNLLPNPGMDHFWINGQTGTAEVSVYDLSGNMVHSRSFVKANRFLISIPELLPGIYFVKVKRKGEVYYGKWIKQ
jgi:hypothetical protein